MKTSFLIFLLASMFNVLFAQSVIEWSPHYELQLSDYQLEIDSRLNTYSIQTNARTDFSYEMTNFEFMAKKNFNSNVRTVFDRNSSYISVPDSALALQLLAMGRYTFDLCELYSRRFRKDMFEKKNFGSGTAFYRPIYEELQAEMTARKAHFFKTSELGKNTDILHAEHQKVLTEINELSEFCQDCRPAKKKRKNRNKK